MNKLQGIIIDDRSGPSITGGLEEYLKQRWPGVKLTPLISWVQKFGPDRDQTPVALLVQHEDMEKPELGYICYVFGSAARTKLYPPNNEDDLPLHLWFCLPGKDPFSYIQENF